MEFSLLDRARRYRRLAALLAEDQPSRGVYAARLGTARENREEMVNQTAKAQAAD